MSESISDSDFSWADVWGFIDLTDPYDRKFLKVYVGVEEYTFEDAMFLYGFTEEEIARLPAEQDELGRLRFSKAINELGISCKSFGGEIRYAAEVLRRTFINGGKESLDGIDGLSNPVTTEEVLNQICSNYDILADVMFRREDQAS